MHFQGSNGEATGYILFERGIEANPEKIKTIT
jgi:ribonuclease HI